MAIPIAANPELKGVGGWLLVFCILYTIGGALFLFATRPFRGDFLDILYLLQAIIAFVVGIHVWSVNKSALFVLKIYFIVALCVRILGLLVILLALLSGTTKNQSELGVALMFSFIGLGTTIAWIGYFRYSQRVKNTYGSNLIFFS